MSDTVKNPKHYKLFQDVEVIDVIASSMSESEFKGYCLGNILKYRLRAGKKDDAQQELDKADFYNELFETKKHLCRSAEVINVTVSGDCGVVTVQDN